MRLTSLALLLLLPLRAQEPRPAVSPTPARHLDAVSSRLSLESLFHPEKRLAYFPEKAPSWAWRPDGSLLEVRSSEGARLLRVDPRTGEADPMVTGEELQKVLEAAGAKDAKALLKGLEKAAGEGSESFLWTPAKDAFVLATEQEAYLVSLPGLQVRALTAFAGAEAPLFSPNGKRLAYLRGSDLFTLDLTTGAEVRLTRDGSESRLNGRLDWVYDEEIYGRGSARAFWWAPDSRRIAFLSFDTSKVPQHLLVDDRSQPQKLKSLRYPKAGDPMSDVKLGLLDLEGRCTWMEPPHPGRELLIVQVGFDPKGNLLAAYQDRIQTWLELRRFEGPVSRSLLIEKAPTAYNGKAEGWQDRLPLPHFLQDGSFLWLSDRSGYRHFYHVNAEGRLLRPLTTGAWDVRELLSVDEKNGRLVFSATERSPIGLDAYSLDLKGKTPNSKLKRLTEEPGTHKVTPSPDGSAFLDSWSEVTTPSQTWLLGSDGKRLRGLHTQTTEAFRALKLGKVSFQQVKTRDSYPMETMLVLPPDAETGRKYPVYQEVYGGPQSPMVKNAFSRSTLWYHFLAQQGFVVWVCDNRSASNKGATSAYHAYRRLGAGELQDQLDGLAWLKEQGFADTKRVALDGWSYGGFLTAYALTHSRAWKVGISGAPVTDFRLYDSIYTERLLALPKDNPSGYADTCVSKAAANLEDKLLLFHGTLDDNVHPQNTIQFADALQKAGKDFDLELLPGAGHSPRAKEHQWFRFRRTFEFLKRNL